jgi:hypothetical protein
MAIWRRAWSRSTQRRLRRCSRQMSHAMLYCRARDDRSDPRVASLGGRVCIACVTDTKVSFSVHLFIRSAHTTVVTDRRQRPYLLRFVCDLYRSLKPTRPLQESSTNRYRTDGILSPVSLAISLYCAPRRSDEESVSRDIFLKWQNKHYREHVADMAPL